MIAPRTLARRVRRGALRRLGVLVHRGDVVACPLCGSSFDSFAPAASRTNAECWRCGSRERQRALWLYLERRPLLDQATSLLHFAPERCLEVRLARRPGLRYMTSDLEPGAAVLTEDITALTLPDEAFDAIICSHVLEHVEDDRAAMRELHRVLRPGGWAAVMVPLDAKREHTYEDPRIVDPGARARAFGQRDHVRVYGRDLVERLSAAGFTVSRERVAEQLGEELVRRHRLIRADDVYLCRKAPGTGTGGR